MIGPWTEASCLGPLRVTCPTKVVTVSMYVTPVTSSFTMQLVLIVTKAGPNTTPIPSGPEDTLQTSSDNWSLHKHAVTPAKPVGSIVCQTTSDSLMGEGGSDWVGNILDSSVWQCWTSLSPKLWLWGLVLGLSIEGESAWWQIQVWRGIAPSPNQKTGLVASSLQWIPCICPQWLPSQWHWPVWAGCPWAWLLWVGLLGVPPKEPCHWIHPHWRRKCSTSSPPRALLCSLPKGVANP